MIKEVLTFWFETIEPRQWFEKDVAFDALLVDKFEALYWEIVKGNHEEWLQTKEGNMAYVIVLDQMARNIFRDTPQSFIADALALKAAQSAIVKGFDVQLNKVQRRFLYMPFMHSEDAAIHQKAVELFTALGNKMTLEYEYKHKAIIDRFGRYPHRNKILGRISTPEEIEFLSGPDSSF